MLAGERTLFTKRVEKFINQLPEFFYGERIPLNAKIFYSNAPVAFQDRLQGTYQPIAVGETWGHSWEYAWLQVSGTVPPNWRDHNVVARINVGGEACVFDDKGTPLMGLSVGSVYRPQHRRDRLEIATHCQGGEQINLWIEAVASHLFGLNIDRHAIVPKAEYSAKISHMQLAIWNEDIQQLWLDAHLLYRQMLGLPAQGVRSIRILRALQQMVNQFQRDADSLVCREILQSELAKPAAASDLTTLAVGHAHIDSAWLWPVQETIKKCARTFSTQIRLLDKYPQYIFGASQAQHYQFVKEHYPQLYEKIQHKVQSGQWEIQGAMWVEADCNITGGESLVRQIIHGKNFFHDEFGVDVDNLWLPDVFGYSAALPQILRQAGIEFFLTQKLSWSQFNHFPHHTFKWQGIDGSEVLTHFPPENTYNSNLRADCLQAAQENFAEKDRLDEFLTLFGIGDGGGGPTEEHIEYGIRAQNLENCPRVKFAPATEFFQHLRDNSSELSTWVGELYLEMHRGTFTSQAHNKKMNRLLEYKLRELEILYSCLPLKQYPYAQFTSLWRTLLLNQFHDIIPGSSIGLVYRQTRAQYSEMQAITQEMSRKLAAQLLTTDEDAVCIINTTVYPYDDVLLLPYSWKGSDVVDETGCKLSVQDTDEGLLVASGVAPLSAQTLRKCCRQTIACSKPAMATLILENELVRYEFTEQGLLKHAFDKQCQRNILQNNCCGNRLSLYEDRPVAWDAWDIDCYYPQQFIDVAKADGYQQLETGPVRQGLFFHYAVENSHIEQRVYLQATSKRLDFETTVDWRQQHQMLRASFGVDIQAPTATFDIQYGYLTRPTHSNTSWDRAKFEVVAHRYADISEQDYGVALLNNCKYGYKVRGNVLDINLLRAPTYPDPQADQGQHSFTYSLLPHQYDVPNSNVLAEAAKLNQQVAIYAGYRNQSFCLPVTVSGEGIVLEVLKKAEREQCLVLRIYESRGRRTSGRLQLNVPDLQIWATDIMEKSQIALEVADNRVDFALHPFEIRTFKVKNSRKHNA